MDTAKNGKWERNQPATVTGKVYLALAGNPNSGKTTIFNAITGARQHVGNYPGVTVERKEGETSHKGTKFHVIDLPGTYSLTAYSPDEKVARDVLLHEHPDVVIQIVDAGNLERNLYLTVQLIAMKVPLVLAFNMMDEVRKRGVKIDLEQLSVLLGVPIVATVGYKSEGIEKLMDKAAEVAAQGDRPSVEIRFGGELDRAVDRLQEEVSSSSISDKYYPRWLAIKLVENDPQVTSWFKEAGEEGPLATADKCRKRVADLMGDDPEILLADARYGWVHGAVAETTTLAVEARRTITDQVDTVLANRVLGLPIFLLFMWLTFYITFKLGEPLANMIDHAFGWLGQTVAGVMPGGLLESLIVDGVIAGVGGVLVFLPNIMLLFVLVSLMEDSGYMARAAFIVDRVMHMVGLHGKSFIPLFLGFGCNVPAIMAARILENERDRKATILVSPFISCSARLPVYVLLTGALFTPGLAGHVIFSLYVLGIVVAMVMARLLRAYVVKGPPTPFVMELPPYRMPTAKSVLIHMWNRAWMYIRKAGTVILAISIVVWFLSNFPRQIEYSAELSAAIETAGSVEELSPEMKLAAAEEELAKSYAGSIGHAIEPVMKPVGLDNWKVGVALFAGFVAKEVVVSTMGTLYSLGEADEEAPDLRRAIKQDPFFTPLKAYVFMVFVLLYMPCLATLVVAYRELGGWKWVGIMMGMSFGTAYVLAAVVWWGGRLIGLG